MFEKRFLAFRPFLLIVMILLAAIGYVSFTTMSKESIPEVNLPFFNVTAVYPGADAETIEQQVISKIEDKLPSVKGISTFKSVSTNNVGVINLEFQRGVDKGTAYADLKSAVDEVRASLPTGVSDIAVTKTDPKDMPVYSFSVMGPYYPSVLFDKVGGMEDELKKIPGVDKVAVVGKYVSQVEVEFDYDKLRGYNLRLPVLVQMLSSSIEQKPVDKKKLEGNLYGFEVRTYGRTSGDVDERLSKFRDFLENVPLVNQNGNVLRLKDLAKVSVTHPFYQRLSYVNGENAVTFMVYKSPGSDILKVIGGVKDYLAGKSAEFAKDSIKEQEMFSQEISIKQTFNAFLDGFRDTSVLIVIIATIFLGLRGSFAVAITFPFVYLLSFIALKQMGYTFNSIVSVALNLSLGIMVDNLIVMAQGAEDGMRKGYSKFRAIQHSLSIYWKPLLIGNLVTISMFLPIGFVLSGKMGEFMKFLPVTVNLTLAFSIVVAFVFLPLVLSYMDLKVRKGDGHGKLEKFFSRFEKPFDRMYERILKTPKFFITAFYALFVFVIIAFAKFGAADFMPLTDKDNIYVNVSYSKDTGMEANQAATAKLSDLIEEFFSEKHPGVVKNLEISLGENFSQSALDNTVYRSSFNPDLTKFNVVLTDTDSREEKDNAVHMYSELHEFLGEKIAADPELSKRVSDVTVMIQKSGPSEGKDVTFNLSLSGSEGGIEKLAGEYEKMLGELKAIDGTYGWTSSLQHTNGKVEMVYDLDRLAQLGIAPAELDAFVYSIHQKGQSNALTEYKGNGISITSLGDFGKDVIPVRGYVAYQSGSGASVDFKNLVIPGTNAYLSEVLKETRLQPQLKSFQHLDGNLVVRVEANKRNDLTLSEATAKINAIVAKYPAVQMAYGADVKDMEQSGKDLGMAFLVGFVLMFAILVLNFGNFRQPGILVATMPLFLTGALAFLLLSGLTMSFMVDLGFFGLIGVGLAHIIYLVNRFNELFESSGGKGDLDAIIVESVKSRLEPVFLTTAITALGLFVLAASDEMWRPFALAFAGGLIVGTTITLVFIPCALKVLYREDVKPKKKSA